MDMDWEPEVPGQWNTPIRIRRQHAVAEVALLNAFSHTESPVAKGYPIDWEPEIPGQFNTPLRMRHKRAAAEAGFSETLLDIGFYTPKTAAQSTVIKSSYFAPIANILAYTFRIFHQIYSSTLRSARATGKTAPAVAGSRHVIEIRRTAANGFESVKRRVIDSGITRLIAPTAQQIIRNNKPTVQLKTPRSQHRKAGTRQMAPQTTSMAKRASPPQSPSVEKTIPFPETQLPMEAHVSSTKFPAPEPPIDREALGAKLWANFTPRPIPGARGLLAISNQSASVSSIDGQPSPSLSHRETMGGTVIVEKPNSPKLYDIHSAKLARPSNIKPSLKSSIAGIESRRSSSDTYGGPNTIEKRTSLPELSSLEKHGSITRNNTVSGIPKIEKTVRFEMNDTNGLPQEYRKRFFQNSKVGDWAPSSPLTDDQALTCTSDLKHNLDALLRDDSWLPPPSTPVDQAELYYSDDDSSSFQEEDLPFSPPSIRPPPHVTPKSTSYHSSVDVIEGKDQLMPDRQLVDERPIHKAPTFPLATDSPYIRIKDLVKSSFRKVFSPLTRTTPSVTSNTDPVQEEFNISLNDHDTSSPQMADLNHSTSLDPQASEIGTISGDQNLAGNIDSPLSIGPYGGRHESTNLSNGSGESGGSYDKLQDIEDLTKLTIEDAIYTPKMSKHSTKKIEERRKQKAAAEVAQRATEEAAAAKTKAEAEEAARKARSHRRIPKEKLVKPLTEYHEGEIRKAMLKGQGAVWTTTVSGTDLRGRDFMTVLGEREWLNDEIINAYLEWVVDYANKKAGKDGRTAIPKVVAHNSFFYKNLSQQGPEKVAKWMTRKRAGGKKLLEVETVLIPVNNASHWTIIVVSPKDRTIEYLDSFLGASKVFVSNTKKWLKQELGSDWREEEWCVLDTKSAEQRNGFDCGVFLLTNAECVAGGLATDSYDSGDMTEQRRRVAAVLLNNGFGNGLVPAEEL